MKGAMKKQGHGAYNWGTWMQQYEDEVMFSFENQEPKVTKQSCTNFTVVKEVNIARMHKHKHELLKGKTVSKSSHNG